MARPYRLVVPRRADLIAHLDGTAGLVNYRHRRHAEEPDGRRDSFTTSNGASSSCIFMQ
jgi:hypothetical protein